MCGIAGIVHWDGQSVELPVLRGMSDLLTHRGPDEEGFYLNRDAGDGLPCRGPAGNHKRRPREGTGPAVGLAHRRLSIIDLSSGQQPLCNEDGTLWIAFNGEIYNFPELRDELTRLGHSFRSSSDTETIVHAYEEWGKECLSRLNGMFAFALWDEERGELFAARDRIGKKPLYYRAVGNSFAFASELKALLAVPGVERRLDLTAVADYFKYLYVPDPKTIYEGLCKLPPAHYLVVGRDGRVTTAPYWNIRFDGATALSEYELADQLFDLLGDAVQQRMVAEVPLGAFLSGGVDSSGIVALMARQSAQPVLTCSIGFDDPAHDESRHAADVAARLGTAHHEFFVRSNFLDTVSRLPGMFDEPFADASALPTYYVCQMARQRVTVALSGDGGDETYAGYDKYVKDGVEHLCGRIVPAPLLRLARAASFGNGTLARKVRTLTGHALQSPARAYYETNTSITDHELENLLNPQAAASIRGYDPFEHTGRHFDGVDTDDHLVRMIYTDLKTYLPGDILVKVDRMSMANSLEVRAPLLDYRLVEFAATLPSRLKVRWGCKKYLLKRVFGRLLPSEIFRRPKHGFTVPLDPWFRTELTGLAGNAFFATPALGDILNLGYVRQLWDNHRSGREERGSLLWSILMFSLWYGGVHNLDGRGES